MKGGIPMWQFFSEEELQKLIDESETIKEFMKKLGYARYRAQTKRQIVEAYPNLDFSKFTNGIFQDLTGQTFGRLTVLRRDFSKTDEVYWICQCSCDKKTIVSVRAHSLKNKKSPTRSCGCLLEEARYNKIKDLSGQKFGHLTVLKRVDKDNKKVKYLCECDCSNKTRLVVLADNLRRGHTTSCGCMRSKGEYFVQENLSKMGINFEKEYSFCDLLSDKNVPLRFDFAIFDEKNKILGLIECQGPQHYQADDFLGGEEAFNKLKYHDEKKKQYCIQKNIPLVEIPYQDYLKIDEEYLREKLKNIL